MGLTDLAGGSPICFVPKYCPHQYHVGTCGPGATSKPPANNWEQLVSCWYATDPLYKFSSRNSYSSPKLLCTDRKHSWLYTSRRRLRPISLRVVFERKPAYHRDQLLPDGSERSTPRF